MCVCVGGGNLPHERQSTDVRIYIGNSTDPSSRQRGRYKITNTQLSEGNFKEKEILVTGPLCDNVLLR
jgi:hypothetical protein